MSHCCFAGCDLLPCGCCRNDLHHCTHQIGKNFPPLLTQPSLEDKVNERWGSTMFDWVIGRVRDDNQEKWFWYCGTADNKFGPYGMWLHGGLSDTINEALEAMLNIK